MASNAPDGVGAIYFITSIDSTWSEDKKVDFVVKNEPGGSANYYDYGIFMGYHPKWQGIITQIRIDPADRGAIEPNPDTIGFDCIELTKTGKGLSADLNCDGRVDSSDFGILMSYWGTDGSGATSCRSPDINRDGIVDSSDFAIMMSQWTG